MSYLRVSFCRCSKATTKKRNKNKIINCDSDQSIGIEVEICLKDEIHAIDFSLLIICVPFTFSLIVFTMIIKRCGRLDTW